MRENLVLNFPLQRLPRRTPCHTRMPDVTPSIFVMFAC